MSEHDTIGDEIDDVQVPVPEGLPNGTYHIALEFRQGNRTISTGHPLTVKLPVIPASPLATP